MRVTFGKVVVASWMLCAVVLILGLKLGNGGDRDPYLWPTGFALAGCIALAMLLSFAKLVHVFVSWLFRDIDLSKRDKRESK